MNNKIPLPPLNIPQELVSKLEVYRKWKYPVPSKTIDVILHYCLLWELVMKQFYVNLVDSHDQFFFFSTFTASSQWSKSIISLPLQLIGGVLVDRRDDGLFSKSLSISSFGCSSIFS